MIPAINRCPKKDRAVLIGTNRPHLPAVLLLAPPIQLHRGTRNEFQLVFICMVKKSKENRHGGEGGRVVAVDLQ